MPKTSYEIQCDAVAAGADGEVFAVVVYSQDGQFNSHLLEEPDLGSDEDVPGIDHLDTPAWLTGLWRAPGGTLFACDANGAVHVGKPGKKLVAEQTPSKKALTCVFGVGEDAYTAGDAGQVFVRAKRAWKPVGEALGQTILGMGGTSATDLYACGAGGLLAHWNGIAWTATKTGTKQRIAAVHAVSTDEVLACGEGGFLMRGAKTTWKALPKSKHDLHSIVRFRKRIFLAAAAKGVVELVGDKLVTARDTFTSYSLSANEHYLVSGGGYELVRSDLERWDGRDYE